MLYLRDISSCDLWKSTEVDRCFLNKDALYPVQVSKTKTLVICLKHLKVESETTTKNDVGFSSF